MLSLKSFGEALDCDELDCAGKQISAGVAQLVEHLICNQRVGGSNPFASSRAAD